MGKRADMLARQKANNRPAVQLLFLSNISSLDNKINLHRLRLNFTKKMKNCCFFSSHWDLIESQCGKTENLWYIKFALNRAGWTEWFSILPRTFASLVLTLHKEWNAKIEDWGHFTLPHEPPLMLRELLRILFKVTKLWKIPLDVRIWVTFWLFTILQLSESCGDTNNSQNKTHVYHL